MEVKMLDKENHLDMETGCLCRYVRGDTEYFRPHFHNYYEIFLMKKGEALHLINGEECKLSEGELLFIRDFDIHDYRALKGGEFEFINLAFSKETFNSLADYLGDGFPKEKLLTVGMPPSVILSKREKERLFFSMTDLSQADNKSMIKLKSRMLIALIFNSYFLNFTERSTEIPVWLEITVERMKNPKNFILGASRMYEISGKSREHFSRTLKQYYGVTVSEFINDLRLRYSASLLLTSNLSVVDIGYESGFENISWFYKIFEKKYGTTPYKYRKNRRKDKCSNL